MICYEMRRLRIYIKSDSERLYTSHYGSLGDDLKKPHKLPYCKEG